MKRDFPSPPLTNPAISSCSSSSLSSLSLTSTTEQQQLDPSINLSLKRVRISTSPGELRLSKDFEQLRTDYGYVLHQTTPVTAISPDGTICVEKDPVDPLRIRIRCMKGNIMFCLQIPRLYPHVPPTVYRVGMSDDGGGGYGYCGSRRSIPPPPLPNDAIVFRPKIIISNSHPSAFLDVGDSVAVYRGWSSVSRLADLVSWLGSLVSVEDVVMGEDGKEEKAFVGAEKWLRRNRFDVGYLKGGECCTASL